MYISWYGQSCFQITCAQGKQKKVDIIIDPFSEDIGLKIPKWEADVLLVSHAHTDHNNVKAVKGNPFTIDGPGEYDVKDIFVQGISSFHDTVEGKERGLNTIYIIEAEDLRICHLGDLGQKELTPEQVDKIGDIDILMLPVGGTYTISAKEAIKIMAQIEPSIIIPMHYQIPKLKIKIDPLSVFLNIMGVKKIEPLSKLTIKQKDIVSEEAKIIVLNP